MVRGLPKSYIQKYGVSKKAWREYRKVHPKKGRSSSPKKTRTRNPTRKVRKRMARRKRRSRRRSMAIPVAPIMGLIGGAAEPIRRALGGDMGGALLELRNTVTGFGDHGDFHPEWLATFWGPVIGGMLLHKFVGGWPLNVNRTLARYNIPIRV